ncbi:COP23 domain-containing protein [Microcoleus sp. CAWBG640]|uniref:COP23 domain-containing protein n=1 Tax=Microcoleus sp. CAWBG640 TaxID=2841653 RepID=UPI00312BAEEA
MMTNNPSNIKVKLIQVLVALGATIGALAGIVAILQFCGITLIKPPQSVTFICGVSRDNVPTTFAQETTNGGIPKSKSVIRWVSDFGDKVNYTPQKRCEEVSNRFQDYSNQGLLDYITTGKENGLDTICVKDKERGGPCRLLWTLKPKTNPKLVLHQLLSDHLGTGTLEEKGSNDSDIYIDVNKLLSKIPVDKN